MIKIDELIFYTLLGNECSLDYRTELNYYQRKTLKKRKFILSFMKRNKLTYLCIDDYRALYNCLSKDNGMILKVINYLGSKTYSYGHSSTMDAYKDLAYRKLGLLLKIDL